jgi:predicted Fe-S protein YdhL (DUF1289 family)
VSCQRTAQEVAQWEGAGEGAAVAARVWGLPCHHMHAHKDYFIIIFF